MWWISVKVINFTQREKTAFEPSFLYAKSTLLSP